jgi:hypothetical protein
MSGITSTCSVPNAAPRTAPPVAAVDVDEKYASKNEREMIERRQQIEQHRQAFGQEQTFEEVRIKAKHFTLAPTSTNVNFFSLSGQQRRLLQQDLNYRFLKNKIKKPVHCVHCQFNC